MLNTGGIAPAELHEAGDVASLLVFYSGGRHFDHSIVGGERQARSSIRLLINPLISSTRLHCNVIPSR